MTDNNESRDLLKRAKVQLQLSHPFFSYLVMNLNLREFAEGEMKQLEGIGFKPTCAVDFNGNMIYSPKFIAGLGDSEIKFVVSHESLHSGLLHLTRKGNRDTQIFNISADLVINNMLYNNNFTPPKEILLPENNEFVIGKKKIKDIDKKSAEQIYDEIYSELSKNRKLVEQLIKRLLDRHIFGKKSNGRGSKGKKGKKGLCGEMGISEKQMRGIEKKWKRIIVEGLTYAKNVKGNVPAGMERLVDDLLDEKVNWKNLLYKYITNTLPFDISYSRPSKRSIGCGVYLPSVRKEEISIVAITDTSGSIGVEELKSFVSEIIGIAKSFANIKIRIICCDYEVSADYEIANGNLEKIRNLDYKGGGGTSFINALDYCKEKYPETKLVIYMTDGYGDKVDKEKYPFKLLWVLSKGGSDECIKDSGDIINL